MSNPDLFQASIILMLAALTSSAPVKAPYEADEARLAGLESRDIWLSNDQGRGHLVNHRPESRLQLHALHRHESGRHPS